MSRNRLIAQVMIPNHSYSIHTNTQVFRRSYLQASRITIDTVTKGYHWATEQLPRALILEYQPRAETSDIVGNRKFQHIVFGKTATATRYLRALRSLPLRSTTSIHPSFYADQQTMQFECATLTINTHLKQHKSSSLGQRKIRLGIRC